MKRSKTDEWKIVLTHGVQTQIEAIELHRRQQGVAFKHDDGHDYEDDVIAGDCIADALEYYLASLRLHVPLP